MLEKTSPECRTRELGRSPLELTARLPANNIPIGESHLSSWLRPRLAALNGVSGCESQGRDRREDLRTCRHLRRAGLRESPLRRGHIQQTAYTVVVGLQRRVVGLTGGLQ